MVGWEIARVRECGSARVRECESARVRECDPVCLWARSDQDICARFFLRFFLGPRTCSSLPFPRVLISRFCSISCRRKKALTVRSGLFRSFCLHLFHKKMKTNWKPGDVLLSHGETPHYHRRCYVSLLSSAWVQVGP